MSIHRDGVALAEIVRQLCQRTLQLRSASAVRRPLIRPQPGRLQFPCVLTSGTHIDVIVTYDAFALYKRNIRSKSVSMVVCPLQKIGSILFRLQPAELAIWICHL